MLERGQSQPSEGSRRCLCRSLDEPFADAPARSIPPRMLAGSRGRGAAAGGVEGSQPGGCPLARNRFARRREKPEACAEFPEGRDGPIHKLGAREVGDPFAGCLRRGGSPQGFGSGEDAPHAWGPASPAQSGPEVTGNQGNGQGKGDHKPQLLKKPVNGKKPLDLTCPDAFSLPVCLPAPAGRSSHCAGTAEVTSQLRWASPEAADGPSLSQN